MIHEEIQFLDQPIPQANSERPFGWESIGGNPSQRRNWMWQLSPQIVM
jgi:hypothetical protein